MRWVWIPLFAAVSFAMIGLSMAINYTVGCDLGASTNRCELFAFVSMVADAWKALGWVAIPVLWQTNHKTVAVVAFAVWSVCFLYAVTSAMGLAAETRGARVGGREAIQASYESASRDLAAVKARRNALASHRSIGELEAAISKYLTQAVISRGRVRGTVAEISKNCLKADWRTSKICVKVAPLREELALAVEAERLDNRIRELKLQVIKLRKSGGALEADPQASLISRLSFGHLAKDDASLFRVLLFGAVIELVSAFGLGVTAAFAAGTGNRIPVTESIKLEERLFKRQISNNDVLKISAVGSAIDYMLDRVRPARKEISVQELVTDYDKWCIDRKRVPLVKKSFIEDFERVCQDVLEGKAIRKTDAGYIGLELMNV